VLVNKERDPPLREHRATRFCGGKRSQVLAKEMEKRGVRIVCISDTHNHHRSLTIPDGDILIHAGDFTNFGNDGNITDFNAWLGDLPHEVKIVISGNHENSMVRNEKQTQQLKAYINNAIFLDHEAHTFRGLRFFGTKFFWPCPSGNPYYDQIPLDIDVLISHQPPKDLYDGGSGCPSLRARVELIKPLLHVFGHIHGAHGSGVGPADLKGTIFANAAMVRGEERKLGWDPIVIDL